MAKKTENIVDSLPEVVKNLGQYIKALKNDLGTHGKDYVDSSTGTVALILKIFGKPFIQKFYKNIEANKLENFGFNQYLIAGINQAEKSLNKIKSHFNPNSDPGIVFGILKKTVLEELETFDKGKFYSIISPEYHPIILFVKVNYERVFNELELNSDAINDFVKHFNENIEQTVKDVFGDSYQKHLEETNKKRFHDSEVKILFDQINLSKIGFKEGENLKYEKTYAEWINLENYKKSQEANLNDVRSINKVESDLILVDRAVDEYFEKGEHTLSKILFIVSDFGKGKSVYLKHFASELAINYLKKRQGFFPVYFNLRNYQKYNSENRLGVISNYLETEYGIRIESDYYKKKKFFFLVDSLDESGDLTDSSISRVVESVRSIQNIDREICRNNRIIITTRPLDAGLEKNIKMFEPYEMAQKKGKPQSYFLSIYGFKKDQFNDWLNDSLRKADLKSVKMVGFTKQILESIEKGKEIDIFSKLLNEKTLKQSELRRPIFAYMVYQLIVNEIDFLSIGKIGVYLSFLNLLTKEAKHVQDNDFELNLLDEIKYRNILHATAKLWMYQRQVGNQGFIRKADICRVLEGKKIDDSDSRVLESYIVSSVKDIHFLSHSYFGENNSTLSFQHQSFAEILLAEYYLKIFIKIALDNDNINEAEERLFLGEPTDQTIHFLKELVKLLKESINSTNDQITIEKRKLLFPLLASLCVKEHNKDLFCSSLYYKWFESYSGTNFNTVPDELLKNWCLTEESICKIVELSCKIIGSGSVYSFGKVSEIDALFEKELLRLSYNKNDQIPDIHKWLSILIGNELETDQKAGVFFNKRVHDCMNFLKMVQNWNHFRKYSSPLWASDYFIGINFSKPGVLIYADKLDFSGLDFSCSEFVNFSAEHSVFWASKFNSCIFKNVSFSFSHLKSSIFDNIKILGYFRLELSTIEQGLFFPFRISLAVNSYIESLNSPSKGIDSNDFDSDFSGIYVNYSPDTFQITNQGHGETYQQVFDVIRGFIQFLKKSGKWELDRFDEILRQKNNQEWNKLIENELKEIYLL